MPLSRDRIVDVAFETLRNHGLAGLSMRRIAQELGVQAGALYYHVDSKQDLLAAVAERILTDTTGELSTTDPARVASDIRQALLPVRDSADVVSFVAAFRPDTLAPLRQLARRLDNGLSEQRSHWAAQTLIHYVLGFVAAEQNRYELARANITIEQPAAAESDEAFRFGVRVILRGLSGERDNRGSET